jgi:Kef-type K+ transport system membrane component KefB
MKHARNVAIIMLVALAVVALPGGGATAGLVGAILSLLIAALLAYFAGRFYRDHQVDLYGLGDRDRGILYLSLGAIVVIFAASWRLSGSTVGTLVEIAAFALCGGGLYRVYRNWRRY